MAIRVLIADDHPAVIQGVRAVLTATGDITVAGEAHSPAALIRLLQDVECDILLMDYLMTHDDMRGERDGFYLLRAVRRDYPVLPIVIFTMLSGAVLTNAVLGVGANAVLCKRDPIDLLPAMLGLILDGNLLVRSPHSDVPCHSPMPLHWRPPLPETDCARLNTLSSREREVVRLLVSGQSLQEIAFFLKRSAKTISNQKRSAMLKLGLSSDIALARVAFDFGLN